MKKGNITPAKIGIYIFAFLVLWSIFGESLLFLAVIAFFAWKYRVQIVTMVQQMNSQKKTQPQTAHIVGQPMNITFKGVGMGKKSISLIIFGAVLLFGFISSVRMIDTGQVGVVTQFGKVTGRELGEGLNFVLPYGFNNVTVYDIKVQKEQVDTSAATQDLQDVTSTLALNYRLKRDSVSRIHQTLGPTFVDKVIAPAMSEVFKGASAQYNAGELITNRAAVKKKAYEGLRDRLAKYDIVVEDFSITNFKFSESFANAIEEKQVAQQNAERAKFNLEAAKTDAEAQKAQSETLSDGYLRKQAIEKWDGKMPQYVGGQSVFNIPLQ